MNTEKLLRIGLAVLIIAVVILMSSFIIHAVTKAGRGDVCDFKAYYVAATALCEHADPYVYAERPYIYPPLFATLCMPLASLSIEMAAACYVPVMALAVLLALFWGTQEFMERNGLQPRGALFAIALLITFVIMEDRIKSDLQMFQVNSLLLFLSIAALRWLDRRPTLAGIALGLAMNIKVFPIIMLPYLLFRRRWKTAAAMAGSTILFGLLPALVIGWKTNLQYLAQSSGGFLTLLGVHLNVHKQAQIKDVTASYSVSIPSGMVRMLGIEHSTLAWTLVTAILVSLILFGAWAYRRHSLPRMHWPSPLQQQEPPYRALVAMEWALLVAIALIFIPQTNSRHLLLLAPLAMLGSALIIKTFRSREWSWALAGTGLVWAGLTLPPGSFKIEFLHIAHVFWQFVGGPAWVLLVSILPLLWLGTRVIGSHCKTGCDPQ